MNSSSERALCSTYTMMSSGAMTVNNNNNNNYNSNIDRKISIKKTEFDCIKRMHYSQAIVVVANQKVGIIVHYIVVGELLRNTIISDDCLEAKFLLEANHFSCPVVYRIQF